MVQRVAFREALQQAKGSTLGWSANLAQVRSNISASRVVIINVTLQLKIEKKAGDSALISMTQNVQSRLDVKQRKRA